MSANSDIKSYRDLSIWQRTKSFAVLMYKITEKFPAHELYGLTSQIRRSAVSMPSNIAEGFRRKSSKEKLQFLRVAYGSGAELETQLEIAHDLGYINDSIYEGVTKEFGGIMKMINRTIAVLENF